MIQVLFFGNLIKKVDPQNQDPVGPIIFSIEAQGIERISDLLSKFSIGRDETSHLFVNGIYSGFAKRVRDGDRVAIFARNMSLLYKWYFTKAED